MGRGVWLTMGNAIRALPRGLRPPLRVFAVSVARAVGRRYKSPSSRYLNNAFIMIFFDHLVL
jgi:hypothetical protein